MERELKFALSLSDFTKLKTLCPDPPEIQCNTYFDDSRWTLRKRGWGLRVRVSGRKSWLTLKCKVETSSGGWHQRQEWEKPLRPSTAQALCRGHRKLLELKSPVLAVYKKKKGPPLTELRVVGSIRTERSRLAVGRFRGELDKWMIKRKVFYELEIETKNPERARKSVQRLFRQFHIRYRPCNTTKLGTLYRTINKATSQKL